MQDLGSHRPWLGMRPIHGCLNSSIKISGDDKVFISQKAAIDRVKGGKGAVTAVLVPVDCKQIESADDRGDHDVLEIIQLCLANETRCANLVECSVNATSLHQGENLTIKAHILSDLNFVYEGIPGY